MAIADLAEAQRGPGPIGEWASGPFLTDGQYRVYVNGGSQLVWTPVRSPSGGSWPVPRFHAVIEHRGWAIALVHPAGGKISAADEDELIAVITRETAARREARV